MLTRDELQVTNSETNAEYGVQNNEYRSECLQGRITSYEFRMTNSEFQSFQLMRGCLI